MKNTLFITLLLSLIIGIKQTSAQFYNVGSEVTIQAGATVTVEGNFFNTAGSNFKNSGTIEIKNQLTNDQVMTGFYTGNWILNGSGTQKISGNEAIWMYSLSLNNPGGFLLQNSILIGKQVDFNNGIMTAGLPSNIVYFTKNGQIGLPLPTDASHINGAVVKEGENQTFKYPVGNGIKYQPIQVAFEDNGNELGLLAKYNVGDAGLAVFGTSGTDATPLNFYNSKEYWDLTPINGGITKGRVTVFWDGYNDGITDDASLRRVAHLLPSTGKWENEGTNAGVGTTLVGSVQSNSVSAWSPFTLGTIAGNPLPITLISFSGKKVNNFNQLNWATSQEINASHFEIERSVDAKMFEKIGSLIANKSENYQFIDSQHLKSSIQHLIYYRLKLVDLDGKYDYTKIINIENSHDNQIVGQFYPNPAISDFSNIDINTKDIAEWTIATIDATGRILKTEKRFLKKGLNVLQISNLAKGINLISFENKENSVVRKLVR
jgi:Secretion system C-terminal sorting domain